MAGELIARLGPEQFVAGSSASPYGGIGADKSHVPFGFGVGLGFVAGKTNSAYAWLKIPAAALLATGITVELGLAADSAPGNVDPVNKVCNFGVTIGPITSGTTTFDENASTGALVSCTEVTGTVTFTAVSPVVYTLSIAVPIANMNALAAGGHAMIRVRRLGGTAIDRCGDRAIMTVCDVRNT